MSLFIVLFCIIILILLITWIKVNPFLAFLLVSIIAGLWLGVPVKNIISSAEKGMGDTLGSLVIIIALGAMLGKLVAESGAAQKIATVMMNIFGKKYIAWALTLTGIIVGIPLFYGVGFVLMVPLIFSVTYQYKLPAVATGLPLLAALSVTHGFLPPHPSPSALVMQFHANVGITLWYGMIIAIPTVIIAGPLFSSTLKKINAVPLQTFQSKALPEEQLPGTFISFFVPLLPVLLIGIATLLPVIFPENGLLKNISSFIGDPSVVMLVALIISTFSLGTATGKSMTAVMNSYSDAVKDVVMILLIIGGAGALKEVLTQSGISNEIAIALQGLHMQPLLLGWLIAAIIRVCVGSSTVAGLTTAGIIMPLMHQPGVDANLMVLSIGAGSLMFSHVNDPGFWMFKEYFNLTMKDTLRSWSLMETLVSVVGLLGVLLLNRLM